MNILEKLYYGNINPNAIAICIIIYLAYGVISLDICGFMLGDFSKCYVKLLYSAFKNNFSE